MFDVSLSVAYIGPKSRTERPRKTKIGTEVAHVAHDSHTTFKVIRSKVNLQRAGVYCGGLPHSLLYLETRHPYMLENSRAGGRHLGLVNDKFCKISKLSTLL